MDFEKRALQTWVGQLFIRQGSRNSDVPKPIWLPDLPHLSQVLLDSDMYFLTEECRKEIRVLGKAANYTFSDYLESEHNHLKPCGNKPTDPILLDEDADAISNDPFRIIPGTMKNNSATTKSDSERGMYSPPPRV
ncbi:hypothetical protein M758_UG143600 [Ceratodon purpureus]|nr:hypothetical protein M758_UG143600 [Ceratodon purpureus]